MRFLPPKKTYVVYYKNLESSFGNDKGTMVVNARSVAKAIKIAHKTLNSCFYYEIINVVDAEEVFDILRMGDNKR